MMRILRKLRPLPVIAAVLVCGCGVVLYGGYGRYRILAAMSKKGTLIANIDRFRVIVDPTGYRAMDRLIYELSLMLRCSFAIKELHLTSPTSEGVAALSSFPELRRLGIMVGTYDNDSLSVLESLKLLEEFEIDGNLAIDDVGLKYLRGCPRLTRLSVVGAGEVQGEFLDSLTSDSSLKELELWAGLDFDDEDLLRLRRFEHLEKVSIDFGLFEGPGFRVFESLPRLRSLRIDVPNAEAERSLTSIPEVIQGE